MSSTLYIYVDKIWVPVDPDPRNCGSGWIRNTKTIVNLYLGHLGEVPFALGPGGGGPGRLAVLRLPVLAGRSFPVQRTPQRLRKVRYFINRFPMVNADLELINQRLEMDLSFEDMHGLNRGRGQFSHLLGASMIL